MGGVIDSSVFVRGERRRFEAREILQLIQEHLPGEQTLLSSIVVAELVHGIYRAHTSGEAARRRAYVRDILGSLPLVGFSERAAWIAGQIRGEQGRLGNTLPFADSLIAGIAMELDFAVLTLNVKDFARVPGLRVVPFVLP